MAIFCERKETQDEITITFKNQAVWYIILLIFALSPLFNIDPKWQTIIMLLFTAIILVWVIDKWKPNQEIRQAMRTGQKVEISGSRFSFNNPFTVKIKK